MCLYMLYTRLTIKDSKARMTVSRSSSHRGATLFAAALTIALVVAAPHGQATLRSQLIGHWRLVSTETVREGEPASSALGPAPLGTIVYTADGRMQAHLTPADRARVRPADASAVQARALARYTAYFGRFAVDEAARTVTHRREGSFVPGERDFVRAIDLSGNRLVLTTPSTLVNSKTQFTRITWERLPAAPVAATYEAAARRAVAGTWELVEHKTTLASGEVRRSFGPTPKGQFIFHPDGHTSVQIVNPERPASALDAASDDDVRALHRTYLAYFGSYDVDVATRKIVVHTTADLNPMNTATDQVRFYEFEGDLMFLQPPASAASGGGQQVSRITWRRVK